MADVATLLADMRVMINSINTREMKDGRYYIYITITVKSTDFLNVIVSKLKNISGIIDVTRSSN
jgi:(p)ppGpp synthase/HD superfamily hydrolase